MTDQRADTPRTYDHHSIPHRCPEDCPPSSAYEQEVGGPLGITQAAAEHAAAEPPDAPEEMDTVQGREAWEAGWYAGRAAQPPPRARVAVEDAARVATAAYLAGKKVAEVAAEPADSRAGKGERLAAEPLREVLERLEQAVYLLVNGGSPEVWPALLKAQKQAAAALAAAQPPRGSLPNRPIDPNIALNRPMPLGGSLTATEPPLYCDHGRPIGPPCSECAAGSPRGVTPALDVDLLAEVMEGMPLDPMATLAVRIASAYNARLVSPEDSDGS